MSLLGALSNAMSGLSVAQHALDVTASNVSNVNTEGYTRKLARQEAVILDGQGAGVRAQDTSRAVDDFLNLRSMLQAARLGRSSVANDYLDSAQARLFGAPGDTSQGVSSRLSALAVAAGDLAADPAKASNAGTVVSAAQDLARELGRVGAEVQDLRTQADQAIGQEVQSINGELSALHTLNGEIAASGPQAALLDRRDALLQSLASRIDLTVTQNQRGTVEVHAGSGMTLLDGDLRQLVYAPASSVTTSTVFGAISVYQAEDLDPRTGSPLAGATGRTLVTGGVRAALTPELQADAVSDQAQTIVSPLQGGRLQGLLEARDVTLPGLADQLGELAGMTAQALNAAHNRATALPPPDQLTGTRTDLSGFAGAARGGTAYVAVVDCTTGSVAATVAVDMSSVGDATDVVAQLNAGLGGYGTASINGSGALELKAATGYGLAIDENDSSVAITDTAGHARSFGFSHFFGLNDLLVADGSNPTGLTVRADIAADAGRLGRARLDVAVGPPPVGTLGGSGDGRGAQALADAFTTTQSAVARAGIAGRSYSLADYAAEIAAHTASAASAATHAADGDQALADDLAARQSAVSGVDLDEEMSRLVLFQQAYGASARVLAITSQLFDELLQIGR